MTCNAVHCVTKPGLPTLAGQCLQDGSICPGVRVEDMGHKMGCNGVDNGKLWFDGEILPVKRLCSAKLSLVLHPTQAQAALATVAVLLA